MKRKPKPAPRQNYQGLYKQAEWQRLELEKKIAAANEEIASAQQRYEKAFPQTVELYREVAQLRAEMRAYKQRLADMLDDKQREFADIARCPQDEYAIQLIRLCKRKIEELSRLVPY